MEHRRPRTPSPRPLVLIVDGQLDTLALNAIALSAMGFDVMVAKDSDEGFSRAWATHPDIIVTELMLRHTSGWEFLDRLKGEPQTRDTPIVIVTRNAQLAAHERARRSGCAALFVKPCSPDRLAITLRELLVPQASRACASRVS
jgi:CheY-like chemotaxis protein